MKKILYIIGMPGSGKLTVAKMLKEKFKYTIVDNHKINDMHFDNININKPINSSIWNNIDKNRELVLSSISKQPKFIGYIFTNVLLKDDPMDRKWYNDVFDLSKTINYKLNPIVLECDRNTLLQRITNQDRKNSNKISDPKIFEKIYNKNSKLLYPEKATIIDVTNQQPIDTFEEIIIKLDKSKNR